MFEHIHIRPLEGEELLQSMATYARMGLPGAIGSIDAVFEPWNKVPKEMHNMSDINSNWPNYQLKIRCRSKATSF